MDRRMKLRQAIGHLFQRFSLAMMTVIMVIIFAVVNDNFLTLSNLQNILEQNAALAIVAVGVTFGIVSRLLNKTRLGRYTYAIGGDELATKEAGVRTGLYKIGIFLFSGFLVGIASVITMARMGAAEPNAVFGLELDAIVAVIIGGNKLAGGEGSLRMTIFGVLFLALLNNGLSTMGLRDAYFYFYKGMVILIALFVEVTSRRMLAGTMPTASAAKEISSQLLR